MQKTATILFLMLFTASVLLTGLTPAQEFVTDGLVAFYSFDKDTVKGDTLNDVLAKKMRKFLKNLNWCPANSVRPSSFRRRAMSKFPNWVIGSRLA